MPVVWRLVAIFPYRAQAMGRQQHLRLSTDRGGASRSRRTCSVFILYDSVGKIILGYVSDVGSGTASDIHCLSRQPGFCSTPKIVSLSAFAIACVSERVITFRSVMTALFRMKNSGDLRLLTFANASARVEAGVGYLFEPGSYNTAILSHRHNIVALRRNAHALRPERDGGEGMNELHLLHGENEMKR